MRRGRIKNRIRIISNIPDESNRIVIRLTVGATNFKKKNQN